jgi:predicted GIY-YIG superfamily endonuclease
MSTFSRIAVMERSTSASATIPAIGSHSIMRGRGSEFVRKYGVTRPVYMETYASPREAIAREKQLKNWHRDWKIRLIEQDNPEWGDLSQLL